MAKKITMYAKATLTVEYPGTADCIPDGGDSGGSRGERGHD